MASFKDLITIANDQNFQSRVLYALEVASIAVMTESTSTNGHEKRVYYANTVINVGPSCSQNAARAVLTNSTISSEANISITTDGGYGIPDGDIQFVVNQIFNAIAGVAN